MRVPVLCGHPNNSAGRPHRQEIGHLEFTSKVVQLVTSEVGAKAVSRRFGLPKFDSKMRIRFVDRSEMDADEFWAGPPDRDVGPFLCPRHGPQALPLTEAREAANEGRPAMTYRDT